MVSTKNFYMVLWCDVDEKFNGKNDKWFIQKKRDLLYVRRSSLLDNYRGFKSKKWSKGSRSCITPFYIILSRVRGKSLCGTTSILSRYFLHLSDNS